MPTELKEPTNPQKNASSSSYQVLTSHEGQHVTDNQREKALAGLTPEAPDLGGRRSDEDFRVIKGGFIGHKPDRRAPGILGFGSEPVRGIILPEHLRIAAQTDERIVNQVQAPRPNVYRRRNGVGNGNSDSGDGDGNGDGEGGRPPEGPRNPEDEWVPESPERGRAYVEQVLDMRTSMDYDSRYGIERNRRRLRRLHDGIQQFVDGVVASRHGQSDFGPHMRFPRPIITQTLVDGKLVEVVTPADFPEKDEAIENMRQEAIRFKERYELGEIGDVVGGQSQVVDLEPLPDLADQNSSIEARSERYNNATNPQSYREWRAAHPNWRQELQQDQEALQNFFQHAKNHGILKEVDWVLNSSYEQLAEQVASGRMDPSEMSRYLREVVARTAVQAGETVFVERSIVPDSNLPDQLDGVWEPYVNWALRRMEMGLRGQPLPEAREGEWSFASPRQETEAALETYWEVGAYPKLYIITAQTEDQLLIAKDTFFRMVKSGMLGRAPTANFEHVKNFIDEFSRAGGRLAQRHLIREEFLEDNRLELEALLYLLVSNYSKEVYNPQQAKEAATAMAMDEGPQRWVRAFKSGRGKTAFFTHLFDYEEMMDIFNNSVGERGELTIIAGHFLQDTIQEIAIERGMGVVLKDYDPREEYFGLNDLGAKIQAAISLDGARDRLKDIVADLTSGKLVLSNDVRDAKIKEGIIEIKKGKIVLKKGAKAEKLLPEPDQARLNAHTANLNRLGLTRNVEELKALYEGFDNGDYHINNYRAYKEDKRLWDEDQQKDEGERSYYRKYPKLDDLPPSIKQSIELGRVQVLLKDLRQAVLRGELKVEPGQTAKDLLAPEDRQIYQNAYDEAESNFEIAFQMQNVMGEKARRGRGFVYADRNEHIQTYFAVSDKVRCRWVDPKAKEKTVINIDGLTTQEIDALIPNLIIQGDLSQADVDSFKKGWMIYKVSRDKVRSENFAGEWKTLYEGMSDIEKEDVVDNLPTYKAENWVQWGVTWLKMKYADAPVEERRQKVQEGWRRLIKEVKTKGYSAQLWDDELGADGQPQLMTYKKPLGRIDPATGEFKKFKNGEVLGFSASGQKVKLGFDNNGKPDAGMPFAADGKLEVYDSADPDQRQRVDYDTITKNTIARRIDPELFRKEMDLLADQIDDEKQFREQRQALSEQVRDTLIEEVVPTFEFAANGADFRSRYTQDSYNYYQGNDRATGFMPHVLAGKFAIAAGLSRPEDEDILARRGMVVDPTRRRTRKFPDVQQEREVSLVASAVLESMQDRMRIRHGVQRAFLPKDANVARMRMGYRNEDWAGMDRFTFGFAELAAQQPQRFTRRLGAEIAFAPLEHDSGPARWGEHGITGAVALMADEISKVSKQRLKGQFGLTKVFDSHEKAIEIYNHLVGYTDPQRKIHVYGLYRKPTDNNEKMHKHIEKAQNGSILGEPQHAIPFIYDFKECFGRLQTVTQDMEVMYSSIDNASGAVNIEKHEVFLPNNGGFNTAIEAPGVLRNNGVGRNRQMAFLDGEDDEQGYYLWLVDDSPGGGANIYADEGYWNLYLFNHYTKAMAIAEEKMDGFGRRYAEYILTATEAGYIKDWLTDKII